MTNDLVRRLWRHRTGAVAGFTKTYSVKTRAYLETFDEPANAVAREKVPKRWERARKLALIERKTPEWRDLYHEIAT